MKLGLGTVQFGIKYGIANQDGQTPKSEVEAILKMAEHDGISYLDTAIGYGESENVLGQSLDPVSSFRIVSKIPKFSTLPVGSLDIATIIEASLLRLKRKSIYAYMFHHAQDLLDPAGEMAWQKASLLKEQGHFQRLGVSVYDKETLDAIMARYPVDIIQVPMNVLDQRFCEPSYMQGLKSKGVEVHVRSVFLQGLFHLPPDNVDPFFDDILPCLNSLHAEANSLGVSTLELGLDFIKRQNGVDAVIVGVDNRVQLAEIINIFAMRSLPKIDYTKYRIFDPKYLNPSNWQLGLGRQ